MNDTRDVFLQRLEKDLIGPFDGLTEALFSKPSDHYLTGILYPKETRIPDSEQEDDDEVFGGKDAGEAEVEQGVSNFRRFRPCTAGISFAVPKSSAKSTILVTIRYGRYIPEPTFIPFDPDRPDNPKPEVSQYWQRSQIEELVKVNVLLETQRIQLSVEGSEHLELFVRMKQLADRAIITTQLINTFEPSDADEYTVIEAHSLFQFSMTINPSEDEAFYPRKSKASSSDEDNRISNLIFRDIKEYATGHNCSVDWLLDDRGECKQISSTWMPLAKVREVSHSGDTIFETKISETSVGELSAQAMYESRGALIELSTAVSEAYKIWIEQQLNKLSGLEIEFAEQAKVNLDRCKEASDRISEGIAYLKNHEDALKAFQLANLVMRVQRSWADGQQDWDEPGKTDLVWRPFQLAFTLMCLASSSERGHADRSVFDLIWFPTGGGKTEAYLLLSAYVLFLRRMRNSSEQAVGLSVMMRYTLRTLTVQQYERAAAMITACEVIRAERYSDILGSQRFSIGLWVGSASTPNKLMDAYKSLNEEANPTSTPAQIKSCPRCKNPVRWKSSNPSSHVSVSCVNEACNASYPFNDLPFFTVDEQIYSEVPSLLIGTVDKFAQIVRKDRSGNLFGCGSKRLPPDLIIQDELHLISGPLGSLTGIYEIAIDELSKTDVGPVKIIGSTATIRRAQEQVLALFDRDVFQFPPAALDADNNGFSKSDDRGPGRLYLGLSSAGRSPKFALQAIAASLLQSGFSDDIPSEKRRYYETLVSYYNSLRELGGALVVMQDDVPDSLNVIARRRGEQVRRLAIPEELTSRKASSEIPDILSALSLDSSQDGFIDVLLASNMLSVGVDIPKLGLMMVNGQPKSMAEYIQATSRVGRTTDGPGLVVTLYNDGKIRDRAHFETFKTWHSALYRSVEASSITPFASRARDKALHAPLVAMARHKLGLKRPRLGESDKQNILQSLLPLIEKRINRIDPREKDAALNELLEFLEYWQERSELKSFWNDYGPKHSLLISAEKAAARQASGRLSFDARPTPNSVRNVEPSTLFKIREVLSLTQETDKKADLDG